MYILQTFKAISQSSLFCTPDLSKSLRKGAMHLNFKTTKCFNCVSVQPKRLKSERGSPKYKKSWLLSCRLVLKKKLQNETLLSRNQSPWFLSFRLQLPKTNTILFHQHNKLLINSIKLRLYALQHLIVFHFCFWES